MLPLRIAVVVATASLPVRLADLLDEARRNNPELQSAREQANAAASSVAPAGALDDPMLMVQLWNGPVDFSTVPIMVQLSQPLQLGGKRAARRDAASGEATAARANALSKVRDIEAAVAKAYFDLYLADRTQEADEEVEGTLRSLIAAASAVRNDVRIGGDGPRVVILSGSNMSGKSTLLRTVGVNVVLALAGAPVTARRLRVSSLVLGATLHVEDSLQAGHSRFYAEILRIRAIVDAARGSVPLLFLLDEILHGTNSYDRRIGAEGIVRALAGLGAIGMVTTHDLALTELAATLGGDAVNMHFEDRLENGRMVFDYRLRPGVVEHSNALALMRAIGLDV